MKEKRDGALMRRVVRIMMDNRVQGGKDRHCLQHQEEKKTKSRHALSALLEVAAQSRRRHEGDYYSSPTRMQLFFDSRCLRG
ncbi:MAG TPA: hypothetical protein VH619_10025 [Verrucomicrobiae bacterium]|jgi:hypothetical protein|nr:hypothetical protein [Verrucomicrobiae bacterium]